MIISDKSNSEIIKVTINPCIKWMSNNVFFHFIVIIILPLIVYFKTISFGFTRMDDTLIIKYHLSLLGNIRNVRYLFCTDAFLHNPGGLFYRPVQTFSFMIDTILGKGWIGMYHLSNLLIHLFSVFSLYFLLNYLSLKRIKSLLFALIFAVHPLLSSDVAWIPSRGDLLIGLIGIWIFISYVYHLKTGEIKFYLIHLFLFTIALFSKETCALFPILLLFYSWVILSRRNIYKDVLPYCSSWIIVILIYYYFRLRVPHTAKFEELFGVYALISNIKCLPIIAGKIFIPQGLTTLPLYDNISLIIGFLITGLLLWIITKSWKEKNWIVIFGILWFILFSLPPLAYKLKNADYFFNYLEHRTYLPMIGFIVALSFFIVKYLEKMKLSLALIFSIVVLLTFSLLSYVHSQDYKNPVTFFTAAIKSNHTFNAFAYTNRGFAFMELKDYRNAITDQESAIEILKRGDLFYNKGYAEFKSGDTTAAMNDFSKAILLDSTLSSAYIYRSTILDGLKRYPEAMIEIVKAEKIIHGSAKVYCKKGNIYLHQNQYQEAINCYSKSIKLNDSFVESYENKAIAEQKAGKLNNACSDWNTALHLGLLAAKDSLTKYCK